MRAPIQIEVPEEGHADGAVKKGHRGKGNGRIGSMKLNVIVHEAEEGGYWAEVPAIPGCATQGETFEELLQNLYEAVDACMSVDLADAATGPKDRVLEIVL